MKNQLTLLNFENLEDLLAGIDTLQQHSITIHEIHSAEPIPGIETKLGTKQFRFGKAIFRFGCMGGMALTSLSCYLFKPQANGKTLLLNTLILLGTLLISGRLFAIKAPKVFVLPPNDGRYVAIVETQGIPVKEIIANLFQYTSAVEISPSLKNIMIS